MRKTRPRYATTEETAFTLFWNSLVLHRTRNYGIPVLATALTVPGEGRNRMQSVRPVADVATEAFIEGEDGNGKGTRKECDDPSCLYIHPWWHVHLHILHRAHVDEVWRRAPGGFAAAGGAGVGLPAHLLLGAGRQDLLHRGAAGAQVPAEAQARLRRRVWGAGGHDRHLGET